MTTAVRLVCDADCACIFDIANSVDIDSPSDKAFDFPSSDKNDDNPSFQIFTALFRMMFAADGIAMVKVAVLLFRSNMSSAVLGKAHFDLFLKWPEKN